MTPPVPRNSPLSTTVVRTATQGPRSDKTHHKSYSQSPTLMHGRADSLGFPS
jgi:hypothetical protein